MVVQGSESTSLERFPFPDALNLSILANRKTLSPSALHALFATKELWKISNDDARELLGGLTANDFSALKQDNPRTLDEDELRRIASLLEIFAALNSLYSDTDLADKWIHLPNNDPFFGGITPLRYLIQGGLQAFKNVEGYLEAY